MHVFPVGSSLSAIVPCLSYIVLCARLVGAVFRYRYYYVFSN
jgi:hypothetical protein